MRNLRLAENHLGYKPYDFVLCNDFLDAKQNRTTPPPRKKKLNWKYIDELHWINDTTSPFQGTPLEEEKPMWGEEFCKLHNDVISYLSSAVSTSLVV